MLPSPQAPGSTGIRGYRPVGERKAVPPDRCLSDACRLEGGAPPATVFCDNPWEKGVQLPGCLLVPAHG